MMIALTPWAISVRMSASWPGASVSRWMIVTFETLPALTACALAEQSIASRQPLPTPPALENPIVTLDAVPPLPPGAVDGDAVHAPKSVAAAIATTRPRANLIRFIETPPPDAGPCAPSRAGGRIIIAGMPAARIGIPLLVDRSHGQGPVHARNRRRRTAPGSARSRPRSRG